MFGVALLLTQNPAAAGPESPAIYQEPTISATHVVFQFAGDLWRVPRDGGEAERLTSSPGREFNPVFSPDGRTIAFSGQYDGNVDVFTIPAEGGEPKRLTAHPAADRVSGWTPDGKHVLFASSMLSPTAYARLFQVSTEGGVPKALPFPAVDHGVISPDGTQLAYVPNDKWQPAWKRYRGGQATPIWITDLKDSRWKAIPRDGWNDERPMWVGNVLYYLSDSTGVVSLYRFDPKSGKRTLAVPGNKTHAIRWASASADSIVLERFGQLERYDLKTKTLRPIPITVRGDFAETRVRTINAAGSITAVDISPGAARLAGIARGRLFTAPASKGDIRVFESESGVERKHVAWSPDSRTIAYITDERGQEELALHDVTTGKVTLHDLGVGNTEIQSLVWSPDSKRIAFNDFTLNLSIFDVSTQKSTKVDTLLRRGRVTFNATWSPDSAWLTYTKDNVAGYGVVHVYDVEKKVATAITDGLSDAISPVFDRGGRYLYFAASTDLGLGNDIQDIAAFASTNATQSVYCAVLRKGAASPLAPESDEETAGATPGPRRNDSKTVIDFDGLESRIIALPIPRQPLARIAAASPGAILIQTVPPLVTSIDFGGGSPDLYRFSFADRRFAPLAEGVFDFRTTADGTRAVIQTPFGPCIVPTTGAVPPGTGLVDLDNVPVKIDPIAEWRRMYWTAIRKQKNLFYDPKVHGVDLDALGKRYEPFLANLKSRADLNEIFTEIFGEICVGHMFIGGGDIPGVRGVPGGLLGADYKFANGRYQLERVYTGERWNPGLYAPLAQPGVEAKAGEYLLAIDGKDLAEVNDLYEALEGKSGRQVRVKLGSKPDGSDAREATVRAIGSENALRFRAWTEDNRKRVAEATGGRVGYVHVPDTTVGGWREFMRYYYAQSGKDAIIIDERFNGGGSIADFFVREMIKRPVAGSRLRYGSDYIIPFQGIYGPKVMIANEMAGSGGDIFPHLFKFHKVGPVIGRRTWGAMISNYGFSLVDGGRISAPDDAMYNPDGTWMIENVGTAPDIEVELDPYLWRQGKDAQLERAIVEIQRMLKQNPPKPLPRPEYPSIPPFKPGRG
ncbi:MAG: PDZ domain-containing protein [Fimbriimonadaceae bacterium]|nr:PDZ domain-containing protein [Fimbriimonadaceae bacterium]